MSTVKTQTKHDGQGKEDLYFNRASGVAVWVFTRSLIGGRASLRVLMQGHVEISESNRPAEMGGVAQ